MIEFKTKLGELSIPNSYADLTIEDHEFIRDNIHDQVAIAKYLTKWNESQLALIDLSVIRPHLKFLQKNVIEEVEPLEAIKLNNKVHALPEDIGNEPFYMKLSAFNMLRSGDALGVLCLYLYRRVFSNPVKYFFDQSNDGIVVSCDTEQIHKVKKLLKKMDIDTVYGCAKFLYDQLRDIAQFENDNLNNKPTTKQIRANVQMFNVLGQFNTIDELAKGDPLKYDDILNMPYNTILLKLHKGSITVKYQRNYEKVMEADRKAEENRRKNSRR